jgi:hypothetical protein
LSIEPRAKVSTNASASRPALGHKSVAELTRRHRRSRAQVVSDYAPAPGSAGFARSVSACPLSSPGISAAPSTATIPAPPPRSARCNTAGATAGDESAARIL